MAVRGPGLRVVTIMQTFGSPTVSRYTGCWNANGSNATGCTLVIHGRTCGVFTGFKPVVDRFNNS